MSWLHGSTDTIQSLTILLVVLADRGRDRSIRALRGEIRKYKLSTPTGTGR